MADSSPVILQRITEGFRTNPPKLPPHAVFVLNYGAGVLKTFNRKPPMPDRIKSKYHYLVDTSEHRQVGSLRMPAMGDVYFFQLDYDATWQVSDPEAVVRRNVRDGGAVVEGFLRDALWRAGRSYSPNSVQMAEEEARRSLRAPFDLGGGLTVTWLSIRLTLDERQSTAVVQVDEDAHTGRLTRSRVLRLRELLDGDESYLMLHLAQHPEDTGSVLQMLAASRERNEQVRLGLLDRMLERGFIQDADIGPLRESILGAPGPVALPASRALPAVLTPPRVLESDVAPEDQAVSPTTPGNVATWKPVQGRKPSRGPK
jgi:hypothetical protein